MQTGTQSFKLYFEKIKKNFPGYFNTLFVHLEHLNQNYNDNYNIIKGIKRR